VLREYRSKRAWNNISQFGFGAVQAFQTAAAKGFQQTPSFARHPSNQTLDNAI